MSLSLCGSVLSQWGSTSGSGSCWTQRTLQGLSAQWGCPQIPLSARQPLLPCTTVGSQPAAFILHLQQPLGCSAAPVDRVPGRMDGACHTRKSCTPCGAEVTSYNPMHFLWQEFSPDLCMVLTAGTQRELSESAGLRRAGFHPCL